MKNKKYEFTGNTRQFGLATLHEIRSVSQFGIVYPGDIGGWIEHEENLSHEGTCWVFRHAEVGGEARVIEDAYVSSNVRVFGDIIIKGKSSLTNYPLVL